MTLGLDIAGVVLGGLGLAHLAVIAYQEARPGRTARSLHRKLNNEKAIYEQFFHRLMAPYVPEAEITMFLNDPERHPLNLQDAELKARMAQQLGDKILVLVLETLEEMDKALAKIRTNVKVRLATRPMSSVNRNLTQLNDINQELRRLDSRKNHKWTIELVLVPTQGGGTESNAEDEHQGGSHETAAGDLRSIGSSPSPSPSDGNEVSHRGSVSISLDEASSSLRDSPVEPIRNLCSVINEDAALDRSLRSLGVMGRAKQYDLRLIGHESEGSSDGHIVTLSDLIQIDNQNLTRRQRMQIAFQLCLSVLQLYTTPWVDEGWNWEESCALRLVEDAQDSDSDDVDEEEKRQFPHIFITQKFYSQAHRSQPPVRKNSTLRILAGDPVLAKLGFALIVLAENKTLAEVRKVYKKFGDIDHGEAELDDLVTAKQFLKSGRLRHEVGAAYEEVVRACIEGQYLDFQDATKHFRKRDADHFLDDAEEAIMHPLFSYCQAFA
ncbi:hypothetical protein LIA77_07735 [Sarocladium implicatum]|nr:hypothetical protein LIA77_07735 [Sarocladium implicatum]